MNVITFLPLQLDNADEQAAQVRRELDGQLAAIEEMARVSNVKLGDQVCVWIKSLSIIVVLCR